MSLVSRLWWENEDMKCWCPSCGECVDVWDEDFWQMLDDGNPEYEVVCPECGQSFYVSENYN